MTRKSILAPRIKPITSWIEPKTWQERNIQTYFAEFEVFGRRFLFRNLRQECRIMH